MGARDRTAGAHLCRPATQASREISDIGTACRVQWPTHATLGCFIIFDVARFSAPAIIAAAFGDTHFSGVASRSGVYPSSSASPANARERGRRSVQAASTEGAAARADDASPICFADAGARRTTAVADRAGGARYALLQHRLGADWRSPE